jgi:hypothetical protein
LAADALLAVELDPATGAGCPASLRHTRYLKFEGSFLYGVLHSKFQKVE